VEHRAPGQKPTVLATEDLTKEHKLNLKIHARVALIERARNAEGVEDKDFVRKGRVNTREVAENIPDGLRRRLCGFQSSRRSARQLCGSFQSSRRGPLDPFDDHILGIHSCILQANLGSEDRVLKALEDFLMGAVVPNLGQMLLHLGQFVSGLQVLGLICSAGVVDILLHAQELTLPPRCLPLCNLDSS